jgi:hypothetical protein
MRTCLTGLITTLDPVRTRETQLPGLLDLHRVTRAFTDREEQFLISRRARRMFELVDRESDGRQPMTVSKWHRDTVPCLFFPP